MGKKNNPKTKTEDKTLSTTKKKAKSSKKNNSKKHFILTESLIAVCLGLLIAIAVRVLTWDGSTSPVKTESKEETASLPTVDISLNEITFQDFRDGERKTKYPGNSVEFASSGNTKTFENVELRGRGNSTWGNPKPPFQLKFKESIDFLNLGEAKTWVFLANYYDDTNLRNDIAFKLADLLEETYATRGEFVKVTMGGEYLGVYYLTHKMETKKGSVNLKNDFGILMEVDNIHRETEDCHDTNNGTCITIKDTVADADDDPETIEIALNAFMDKYNQFEEATRAKDYARILELIDVQSFVEYYIISEVTCNPDAYDSSLYYYMDGLDDMIHAGPIWDYDYAMANPKWRPGATKSLYTPYIMTPQNSLYVRENTIQEFVNLATIPEFMDAVKLTYREKIAKNSEELINWIKSRAASIKKDQAENAKKWNIDNFEKSTEELIEWIEKRLDYLNYQFEA